MSQFTTNRLETSAFQTIQTPAGSSPVAGGPQDTLTLISSNGTVLITGNAITDTIDFTIPGGVTGFAFRRIQNDFGSDPIAVITSETLDLISADSSVYYFTGSTAANSSTLTINYAATAADGIVSQADWNTFNNKADFVQTIVSALIFG
jgi:hypothetical protein